MKDEGSTNLSISTSVKSNITFFLLHRNNDMIPFVMNCPFMSFNHMFVVSNTGVKGHCLHTFLIHLPKNAARNFLVFNPKFYHIISISLF